VDRKKFQIQIPLPPKIDPSVSLMQIQEKPDVTYKDVGGCTQQIEQMREVVELPMLHVRACPYLHYIFSACCKAFHSSVWLTFPS
jgi:26S proteasome regulatory subunit T1